jgi:quercetin dioxygenase-like cupin family protein
VFCYHDDLPAKDLAEGLTLTTLGASENLSAVHWDITDGTKVPPHQHESEQFGYVIKGAFEMNIGDETAVLRAGDAYFIPANVPHSFVARGATEAIDVFSPKREVTGYDEPSRTEA